MVTESITLLERVTYLFCVFTASISGLDLSQWGILIAIIVSVTTATANIWYRFLQIRYFDRQAQSQKENNCPHKKECEKINE